MENKAAKNSHSLIMKNHDQKLKLHFIYSKLTNQQLSANALKLRLFSQKYQNVAYRKIAYHSYFFTISFVITIIIVFILCFNLTSMAK